MIPESPALSMSMDVMKADGTLEMSRDFPNSEKGSDRKYLRGLAHGLNPVVLVGKNGATDEFMVFVNRTLDDHELIKVKFIDHKDDKKSSKNR